MAKRIKAVDQPDPAVKRKARQVYRRLLVAYSELPLKPRREPMHELISTMLSHRTTQKNESLAFHRMWDHFGSWEAIRDAPVKELAETISQANYAEVKAPNIQATLRRILDERGDASIDFLATLPAEEGLQWLMSLPGVGIKTASLVLLFCFSKPVLPIDTHVHRVSQRLGLIGPKVSPAMAHLVLPMLFPHDAHVLYNFHIGMLKHGQRVCVWAKPRCDVCPLIDLCNWYATMRGAQQEHARETAE